MLLGPSGIHLEVFICTAELKTKNKVANVRIKEVAATHCSVSEHTHSESACQSRKGLDFNETAISRF